MKLLLDKKVNTHKGETEYSAKYSSDREGQIVEEVRNYIFFLFVYFFWNCLSLFFMARIYYYVSFFSYSANMYFQLVCPQKQLCGHKTGVVLLVLKKT